MRVNTAALRVIRERSGYSQASLARAVGVTRAALHNLESGTNGASDELLKRIADELQIPLPAITYGPYTKAGKNLLATGTDR